MKKRQYCCATQLCAIGIFQDLIYENPGIFEVKHEQRTPLQQEAAQLMQEMEAKWDRAVKDKKLDLSFAKFEKELECFYRTGLLHGLNKRNCFP
jgi:hypothetical protein